MLDGVRGAALLLLALVVVGGVLAQQYSANGNVYNDLPQKKWSFANSSDGGYQYYINSTAGMAWFKTLSNQPQTVKYAKNASDTGTMFQPQQLNYLNDLGSVQMISAVQAVAGTPNNATQTFTYAGIWGVGTNLSYNFRTNQLKEYVTIANRSSIVPPTTAEQNGGHPYVQAQFLIDVGTKDIVLDGGVWSKTGTSNPNYGRVTIRSSAGTPYYVFEKPYAVDAAGARIPLYYVFRKSGSNLYVSIENTTFSWMNDSARVFPIVIDPTIITINTTSDIVQFEIIPEYARCEYLHCEAEIVVEDKDGVPATFNSNDLRVFSEGDYYVDFEDAVLQNVTFFNDTSNTTYVAQDYVSVRRPTTDNITITLPAYGSKTFIIHADLPLPDTQFKYNVTFFFFNQTWLIDPYFNTTNTSFNAGTYNNTGLNNSGYVELNATGTQYSAAGNYVSQIFDTGGITNWTNITWSRTGYGNVPNYGTAETSFYDNLNMSGSRIIYHLDVASGNITNYASTSATNGTNRGTGGYQYPGIVNAYAFNSSGAAASGINTGLTDSSLHAGDFTISLWFKEVAFVSGCPIYYATNTPTSRRLRLLTTSAGTITSATYGWSPTASYTTGQWNHYVLTVSGTNGYVYMNGALAASTVGGVSVSTAANTLYLLTDTSTGCNMAMDEFIFLNRSVSTSEVAALTRRGAAKLNLSVRGCSAADCSDANFTYVAEPIPNGTSTGITVLNLYKDYFQYRINFTTTMNATSPFVNNVTIGYNFTHKCACPGANNNWTVNMSQNCRLSAACNLGTGGINFTGTNGNFYCKANLTTHNIGGMGTNNTFWVYPSCYVLNKP